VCVCILIDGEMKTLTARRTDANMQGLSSYELRVNGRALLADTEALGKK